MAESQHPATLLQQCRVYPNKIFFFHFIFTIFETFHSIFSQFKHRNMHFINAEISLIMFKRYILLYFVCKTRLFCKLKEQEKLWKYIMIFGKRFWGPPKASVRSPEGIKFSVKTAFPIVSVWTSIFWATSCIAHFQPNQDWVHSWNALQAPRDPPHGGAPRPPFLVSDNQRSKHFFPKEFAAIDTTVEKVQQ